MAWFLHAMYRILAAYAEWIEGYHDNYDSGMKTLSTEMNTPFNKSTFNDNSN